MSTIVQRQKESKQLDYLAAQRQLYSNAKFYKLLNIIFSVPVIVVLSFLVLQFPDCDIWVAFWSILVPFINSRWLKPQQRKMQEAAATIQQMFDAYVLEMDLDRLNTEVLSDRRLISDKAKEYERRDSQFSKLINWYPIEVEDIPVFYGRLICQHENISWDDKLRKRYAGLISWLVVILSVILLIFVIINDWTFRKFLLLVALPLLPIFIFREEECLANTKAISEFEVMKNKFSSYWTKIISSESISETEIRDFSYELQQDIDRSRRNSPLIFDWVYENFQDKDEQVMKQTAKELIQELKDSNKIS